MADLAYPGSHSSRQRNGYRYEHDKKDGGLHDCVANRATDLKVSTG
jgi:hypothetical protein